MEDGNFFILLLAAFVPLILKFVWYHPKVFGTTLARILNRPYTHLADQGGIKNILMTYLFGLFMSYILLLISVHQFAVFQLFMFEESLVQPDSPINTFMNDFYNQYGDRHRSFFHGVIHGLETSVVFSLGLLGISTLIEGFPLKRMWIHIGYFAICGALMGGLICAFF